jgi:hypothetical protein
MMKLNTAELDPETTLVENFTNEAQPKAIFSPIEDGPEAVDKQQLHHRLPHGVEIGTLVGFLESSEPLVDFAGNGSGGPLTARATVALEKRHSGQQAVLLFEGGDQRKPIIIGLLHQSQQPISVLTEQAPVTPSKQSEFGTDGDRLVFTAEREIVIRCGEASITLTRAGKILIRGSYLVSRSLGMNRIKGGVVHIN